MAHQITNQDSMFSVRKMPWHGLGVVLDKEPESVDDALDKAGLGWSVGEGDVLIRGASSIGGINPSAADVEAAAEAVKAADMRRLGGAWPTEVKPMDDAVALSYADAALRSFGASLAPAVTSDGTKFKANVRQDNGHLLGIVTEDYTVVDNRDAFRFLDELIGSELHFETAGSLQGGRRVWVLARVPEFVEFGGDQTALYIFVANAHDGSMSVTAAPTPVRIVCANTLGSALRQTEYGEAAQRTFRFRHTGDLRERVHEARKVMNITVNYNARFKAMADNLALAPMTKGQFERKVLDKLFVVDEETGKRARTIRTNTKGKILDIFTGKGPEGDTTGNAGRTKWGAYNAVAEFADYGRVYTKRTNQMARSFEDTDLKQRALDLVTAA